MRKIPKVKKPLKLAGIDFTKKYVCMECGCQRDPINAKRGSLVVEIFMWLLFLPAVVYSFLYILPGAIYSIWRWVRRHQVCSNCRNPSIVLTSSPRAMGVMRLMKIFSGSLPTASVKPTPGSSQAPISGKQAQPPLNPTPVKKDLNKILKTSNRRGLRPKGQQGLVDFKPPDQDK
jgi:hypothetical protein